MARVTGWSRVPEPPASTMPFRATAPPRFTAQTSSGRATRRPSRAEM